MQSRKNKNFLTICFLSHSAGIAGAEKAFPKLLEGLQKNGIKIRVLLPSAGEVMRELDKRDISFEILHYSRWLNQDNILLKRIKRTIKNILMILPTAIKIHRWKCDVVYSNTSTICVGAFAAKLLGLPHIWHFREFGSEDYGYKYDLGNTFSLWLTNKLSTVCLTNSKAVYEKYRAFIPEHKLKVIYEGYENDLQETNQTNLDIKNPLTFKCIIVGTLHEAKGHKDAIRAIKILLKTGRNIKLYIVGSGFDHYKKELQELINELGIEQSIEFLGYLTNPKIVIAQCDLLLMCSRSEAFGLVTIEAMQAGIPVIGTRAGGTVELIREGVNGFLYTPENYIELAEKIDILYQNPERAKKMGIYGKLWVNETFTFTGYVQETLNIIKQLKN